MNYEQEFDYFYNKYYFQFEKLIKRFLISQKSKGKNADIVYNELGNYLALEFSNKISVTTNPNLKDLLQLFEKRFNYYEINEINSIFANEIKTGFDKIEIAELPLGYTLRKLLIEIALINIANEIGRLLQLNRNLFKLFYRLDDFSTFEIKDNAGLSIEDTAIYKSLYERLHPDYYKNVVIEDDFYEDDSQNASSKIQSLPITIAMLHEIGFFELDKIRNLSPNNQSKIIAFIQQKDINNANLNRAISGNIRVLCPDNKEDGFKYTSHKHAEKVKAVLKDIKLGNQ